MQILSRFQFSILAFMLFLTINTAHSNELESSCFGTTSQGALQNGTQLPKKGMNFSTYSQLGWMLGRTYVHSKVAAVILQAYEKLMQQLPANQFIYAETGWSTGGDFAPHKTHQNGLSVDFMVPVVDELGQSTVLPTSMTNQMGYAIEFDASGKYKNFNIDFESMALHLEALNQSALSNEITIKRVFFDPQLQIQLFNTNQGEYLSKHLVFNQKQAWVRHDEHYHVDFEVKCLSLP